MPEATGRAPLCELRESHLNVQGQTEIRKRSKSEVTKTNKSEATEKNKREATETREVTVEQLQREVQHLKGELVEANLKRKKVRERRRRLR